jgi:tetratricopeptide (TPR) repeat protein
MTTTHLARLLVGSCLLAGLVPTPCPGDDETFDQRYRAMRNAARDRKADAETLKNIRALADDADDASNQAKALQLLAETLQRQGRRADAAGAWMRCFEACDRAGDPAEAWRAITTALENLERHKPFPREDAEEIIGRGLRWEHADASRKGHLLGRLIDARVRDRKSDKAVVALESLLDRESFTPAQRARIRASVAEYASRAGMQEKVERIARKIIKDPHALHVQRGHALFRQAERLAENHRYREALARAEQAVGLYAKALEAEEDIGYHQMSCLRWAGNMARTSLLDYDKAMMFYNKMIEFSDSEYWGVPARLEIARTYRMQRKFDRASAEYDKIDAASERYNYRALLPRAEMILYDRKDMERGVQLLTAALHNKRIHIRERSEALFRLAEQLEKRRDHDAALAWLGRLKDLPCDRKDEITRNLPRAHYLIGRIHQLRGHTDRAKAAYAKAMGIEGGDMRYRVQARDALESIEYFE